MNWQIRVYNPVAPDQSVTAIWSADAPARFSLGSDANADLQIPTEMSSAVKNKWTDMVLGPEHPPRLEFTNEETYKIRTQSLFEGINFLLEEQLVIELRQIE